MNRPISESKPHETRGLRYIAGLLSRAPFRRTGAELVLEDAHGQTMAIFDARHILEIGRVLEIGTGEVTVEQFPRIRAEAPNNEHRSPTSDCPMGMMNWYLCIEYCNWLRHTLNRGTRDTYPTALGIDNRPGDEIEAVLDGGPYRLPTRSEWEYASTTSRTSRRYFGLNDSLIDNYFFHVDTSLLPGRLRT